MVFCTGVAFGVEDKKKYQLLYEGEYKQVVISTYDGMFVTMDCEIRDNGTGLYIDNSRYRLVDMAEYDIEYHKFDIVETQYKDDWLWVTEKLCKKMMSMGLNTGGRYEKIQIK